MNEERTELKAEEIKEAISLLEATRSNEAIPPNRRAFVLHEGNAWNPLQKYPRNAPCFCNSGKKAKKCCLPRVIPYVKQAMVPSLQGILDRAEFQYGRG
jgi:uncharacterized protein YecA (UPF0149 family)